MLILTRKKGEAISIGDHIQIQVMNIKGGQVRIGIQAPHDISVERNDRNQKSESHMAVSTP